LWFWALWRAGARQGPPKCHIKPRSYSR